MAVDPTKEPTHCCQWAGGDRLGRRDGTRPGRSYCTVETPAAQYEIGNEVGSAALGQALFDVELVAFRVCHGDPA